MDFSSPPPVKHATALGVLCGAGSALFWALGFVAARHGVLIGMSPLVLALHRFVWPGLALLPVVAANGFARSRRPGLAPRHRDHGVRRTAARAVELHRLRVRAARPRQHHSTFLRRGRRTRSWRGLSLKEPLPPRRIAGAADHRSRPRRDRRRGVADDGLGRGSSAISCSSPPAARLRFSACCCDCGGFRRCSAAAVTSVLSLVGLPILLLRLRQFSRRRLL